MFEGWSDERFAIWLAGFFDGEGCIHIPRHGVDLNLSNTNEEVIRAVFERVGVGFIEITSHGNKDWKPKHSWRVKAMPEAHLVLTLIRPHLVLKAEKADEALVLTRRFKADQDAVAERNRQIVEMSKTHTQKAIAEHFGLRRQTIGQIVNPEQRERLNARRRVPDAMRKLKKSPRSQSRVYRCGHVKAPVVVTTKCERVIDSLGP